MHEEMRGLEVATNGWQDAHELAHAAAALSVRHATQRWTWFSTLARRAPYASGVLIIVVGLYVGYHGWAGLEAHALSS